MTVDIKDLDPHEQPSDELRAKWKAVSRTEPKDLRSEDIDDLRDPRSAAEFRVAGSISSEVLNRAFQHLCPGDTVEFRATQDVPIYYHPLYQALLNRLIHRDLSNPVHQTNLHLHFDLPYPAPATGDNNDNNNNNDDDDKDTSFFSYPPSSTTAFRPKDAGVHKPLSVRQALERKLHWVTLGGQYDWTRRVYPAGGRAPAFPADVAGFLETLFPETRAEAAIVNFYSPGDTMMMHRDVSEETDRGLVSLSFGCDGLFMIAPGEGGGEEGEEEEKKDKEFLLLRLRSGDAIYMTKESRFAWHGVPKVLKGTCPDYLEDWPAEGGKLTRSPSRAAEKAPFGFPPGSPEMGRDTSRVALSGMTAMLDAARGSLEEGSSTIQRGSRMLSELRAELANPHRAEHIWEGPTWTSAFRLPGVSFQLLRSAYIYLGTGKIQRPPVSSCRWTGRGKAAAEGGGQRWVAAFERCMGLSGDEARHSNVGRHMCPGNCFLATAPCDPQAPM
ncbi:hypothetical protein VTH06DRAFT_8837 [Thermothelomyces fergusii]